MMDNAQFWQRFTAQYGDSVAARLREALAKDASVSIRLNPQKAASADHDNQARCNPDVSGLHLAVPESLSSAPVPWCSSGFYLEQRPAFTFDPLFHAGAYYVQEAGSMFLEQALRQYAMHSRMALDLCAAPGGKSTLARSVLADDCVLVSNEPMPKRAQVLVENIVKWGHPNCMVTQNYPKDFARFDEVFDLVIADVPCSGEGMFRREAEAVAQWSTELVEQCAALQRSIIEEVWPALQPGGILVYSTCTYNHLEDEDNVEWICRELGAEVLPVSHEPEWGIVGSHHFIPGCTRSEGFFLAVLRKAGGADGKGADDGYAIREARICHPRGADILSATLGCAIRGKSPLNVLHAGVPKTMMKGKVELPSPALALSILPNEYPHCDVDARTALAYLRGESIAIDAPRGFVVVCYRGHSLGFVKNLGNRANNLYPDAWRVRSTYGQPVDVIC